MAKKKIMRLCDECYYDYKAGGMVVDKKRFRVVKIGDDIDKCDANIEKYFPIGKSKLKKVI